MRIIKIPLWIWGGIIGICLGVLSLSPIVASDIGQTRFNKAVTLTNGDGLSQTFAAQHNGLSAVEILAVAYPNAPVTATLTIKLWTANRNIIAEQTYVGVKHNQRLKLEFVPLYNSQGAEYTLSINSLAGSHLGVWAYSLDGLPQGFLTADQRILLGDLYFQTYYTYLWAEMIADVSHGSVVLVEKAWLLWITLFAPGVLVLRCLRFERLVGDHWARWGVALSVSLAIIALAWQWATIMNWRWTLDSLRVIYNGIGGITIFLTLLNWRTHLPRLSVRDGVVFGLLVIVGFTRWWAVRDLVLPQWVDSPHHLLVARVLAEAGQMPYDYEPLLPVTEFTYHFGFHALIATWQLLTQDAWPDLLLLGGQVLNVFASLAALSSAVIIARRPWAGVIAAWYIGLVTLFPAYYVSWGRYTQLAGWLILFPLLGLAWRLVSVEASVARRNLLIGLIAVLASGLTLTHYRVLGFFATFVLVALAIGRRHGWKWISWAALLACLLSLPWLWQLLQYAIAPVIAEPHSLISQGGYNAFPWDYFKSPLERAWLILVTVVIGWGLWRGWRLMWLLAGWVAFTMASLNIGPGSWLVNNNSWAISLFAPGALVLSAGVARWWTTAQKWRRARSSSRRWVVIFASYLVQGAFAVYIGLLSVLGLQAQITVVNPVTTLYTAADRTALEWVAQNVSNRAIFWNNAWQWQDGLWASSDGGAWLWPWLNMHSTAPPIDYYFDKQWLVEVNKLNEQLAQVTDARAPATLELLRQAQVTHIYIGARGGNLKPEMFVDVPGYKLLYTNGAAWVFEIVR